MTSKGNPVLPEKGLTTVRYGRFSGSAVSLVAALHKLRSVVDVDVLPLARAPSALPRRLAAHVEASRDGGGPWMKTSAWSRYVQDRLDASGALGPSHELLFIQSVTACIPERGLDYQVYTDRVGLEGANIGGQFRSRFSQGWLEREMAHLRGARRVLVMGPSTKHALLDSYGLQPSQVEVVGAGPNCSLGPPITAPRCRRFLFVGTQWRLKGGPTLLRAFSRLRQRRPDLELMVVGAEPPGPLPRGVTVVGRVPHDRMDEIYSRSQALVIPTHMEAFGIAHLEALMKGLPCIGTTVGNQSHIIGDAGIVVEPGDVVGLEDAMDQIAESYPEFAARAQARGRALSATMSWEAVAMRILDR